MRFEKPIRIKNDNLLMQIAAMPCVECGRMAEPHHITSRGAGGGDIIENLIPLCRFHHSEWHQIGSCRMVDKYEKIFNYLIKYNRYDILGD